MTGPMIRVLYSCPLCGLVKTTCDVPARGEEEILVWFEGVLAPALAIDHQAKSPNCQPAQLKDVMIPMAGADRIGAPTQN